MQTKCEECINYAYDEDYECWSCGRYLDEDEMYRFMTGTFKDCPYYRRGDDYTIVKKQN